MDLRQQTLDIVKRAFANNGGNAPARNRISLLTARSMALMKQGRLGDANAALGEAETLASRDPSDFTSMRLSSLHAQLLLAMSRPGEATAAIDRLEALATRASDTFYGAKSRMLRGQALMHVDRIDEDSSPSTTRTGTRRAMRC